MPRLPQPGGDEGQWGGILNDYLSQSHDATGALKANTVGDTQLKPTTVDTIHLKPGAISSTALADNAVTSTKVATGAISTTHLQDNSITTTKLATTNQANGIAVLDSNAKLPEVHIPTRLSDNELSAKIGDAVAPVEGDVARLQTADGQQDIATARTRAMLPFQSAVGARNFSPVNICVIGDSTTEGHGATAYDRAWINLLGDALTARLPVRGLTKAGFRTMGGWPAATSYAAPMTLGGTDVTDYGRAIQYGLPKRNLEIKTGGGSYTFTFEGTSFDLIHTRASASGKFNIVIDGGTAIVYDTVNAATLYGQVWSSGALTPGSHTVVIKRDASTTAGRNVYIEQVVTYNGDETKGFHVWNGGHYGWTVNHFITGQTMASFTPGTAADALVIMLGLNDVASISAAQFKTNMLTLITQATTGLATVSKAPTIVLVASWQKYFASGGAATWGPFVQALYEIAAVRTDTVVFDMTKRWPPTLSGGGGAATFNLYSDNVHASDKGNGFIADALADFLVTV